MMISSSLAGLHYAGTAQQVNTNNIANMTNVDYQEKSAKVTEAGVKVTLSDASGARNNVNLEKNMTDITQNKHAYTANLAVIQTQDDMHRALLDIIA